MNRRQAGCVLQHLVRTASCWKCYAKRSCVCIQFSHSSSQAIFSCARFACMGVLIHEQTLIFVRLGKNVGNLSKALSLSLCHCHVLRSLWR